MRGRGGPAPKSKLIPFFRTFLDKKDSPDVYPSQRMITPSHAHNTPRENVHPKKICKSIISTPKGLIRSFKKLFTYLSERFSILFYSQGGETLYPSIYLQPDSGKGDLGHSPSPLVLLVSNTRSLHPHKHSASFTLHSVQRRLH